MTHDDEGSVGSDWDGGTSTGSSHVGSRMGFDSVDLILLYMYLNILTIMSTMDE